MSDDTDTAAALSTRRIACVWLPHFGLRVAAWTDPLASDQRGQSSTSGSGATTTGTTPHTGALERVALFRPGTRWQELLECSADLEAYGIVPGTPLKEAQTRFPDARYLPCDTGATLTAIATAFAAVVAALAPYSPVIEPALGMFPCLTPNRTPRTHPGVAGQTNEGALPGVMVNPARAVIFLDVVGLTALYGPETELAARLARTAATAATIATNPTDGRPGLDATCAVGIAAGKFTAWVAASTAFTTAAFTTAATSPQAPPRRLRWREIAVGNAPGEARGLTPPDRTQAPRPMPTSYPTLVVPPWADATFLGPLPLATLPLAYGVRRGLERLGIHTLQGFASLPDAAVMARYGPAARHAHRLAIGQDTEPLRPLQAPREARVSTTFEWEETDLDRLTFILRTMARDLVARLHALDRPDGAPDGSPADPAYADDCGDPFAPDPVPIDDIDDPAPLSRRGQHEAITSEIGSDGAPIWADGPIQGDGSTPRRRLHSIGSRIGSRSNAMAEVPAPYAVEALRVIWHLAPRHGEEVPEQREALLRLAEPGATSQTFATHLRWHVEGLDRLLADAEPTTTPETPALDQRLGRPTGRKHPGDLTYTPMADRGRGVVGITIEAAGIGTPPTQQLSLHVRTDPSGARSGRNPTLQARGARLAIARLQARWGDEAVGGLTAIDPAVRLPEQARHWGRPIPPLPLAGVITSNLVTQSPTEGRGTRPKGMINATTPYWLVDPPQPVRMQREKRTYILFDPGRVHPTPRAVVQYIAGPWHVVDPTVLVETNPPHRAYFQIETTDRRAYLIYRDDSDDRWFLQGVYD